MFDGMLKIAGACDACEVSFESADVGDGASVFVMFFVSIFAIAIFMLAEVAFRLPIWGHALGQLIFIPIACIMLLRPVKGILFALQFSHDASEARLDDD